jgi:eukaryotic-like serine/threonine-protein kinase
MSRESTLLHGPSGSSVGEQSSDAIDATEHDGGDPSLDWDVPIGTELGRYVLLDRLGSGAMGLVYSAFDAQLDRKIAIKIVKARRRSSQDGGSGAARLMREAQALARLSHPNVVPIYDVGMLGDRVWVALEYVEGWTVREWMDRRPRHWRDVLDVFVQAARGLIAAHTAQLVHRDFKPDNVLLDRARRARVTDFGLARVDNSVESEYSSAPIDSHDGLTESLTRTGSVMGTPGYMSPEQHFGKPADARSDQFAFCVALFEAVYGERPFAGGTIREVAHAKWTGTIREPRDLARRPHGIPRALDLAIRRGLAGASEDRWPTMGALVDELERLRHQPRTRLRVASIGILAIVGAAWAWHVRPRDCASGRERLGGIWDDARTQELEQAFASAGTPAAETAWATTRVDLDEYADAWASAYDRACPDDRGAVERDAALLCLQRRRTDLRAAVDALAQGDRATVHRAVAVLDGLEPVEPCLVAGAPQPQVPEDSALAAKVETAREHLADAIARREAGQYAIARDLSRAAALEAAELGFPPLSVETDIALGVALGRNDVLDEGTTHLTDAFLVAREHGIDVLALDAAIHLVFLAGVSAGHFDEGLEWVRHGEAMLQRLPNEDPLRRARLVENRSLLFTELGRYDEAESGFEEALALRMELGGERGIAMVHNNYGNLLARQRRFAEAFGEHQQALALRKSRLGPRHPEVAMSIVNLARLHLEQYRYEEGLENLDEGQAILAETLGDDNSMMATTLQMRGIAYLRLGEAIPARTAFERALAIRVRLYGADHPDVGEMWNVIAGTYMDEGDYGRAEEAFLRARAIFEQHGPDARGAMLRVRANLGALAARRGEYRDAERIIREVLGELEEKIGTDNPELVASLKPLSVSLLGLGRPAEALPVIERAQRLQRIADNDASALDYLEFLRLRAELDLERDRPQARAQIEAIAERLRVTRDQKIESVAVDKWIAEHPAR